MKNCRLVILRKNNILSCFHKVEFMYILSDWFRQECYKDTRDYIISVGCSYYYNYIPLHELGLPVPPVDEND